MHFRTAALLGILVPVLAACVVYAPSDPARDATADPGKTPALLASLQAETRSDGVRFVYQVTNTTPGPIELQFSSGQSYDFEVRREGRSVWRWSAERVFTQALRRQLLAPGETLRYDAQWTPGAGSAGEYTVTAQLADPRHPAQQTTTFRLP